MGLCKCPKRKVTNQFCYEHRVNVCEYCMVTNHPKCIVQSYLQWLQDSDYNPLCELCKKDLATENCVRLTCYHVYHWSCLDHYARQLPNITAPAGYKCPNCKICLFPANNLVSPVADVLREKLSSVNWARIGLGLPLLNEDIENKPRVIDAAKTYIHTYKNNNHNDTRDVSGTNEQHSTIFLRSDNNIQQSNQNTRRVYQSVDIEESIPSSSSSIGGSISISSKQNVTLSNEHDHDEDKYKRRSLLEWLKRWWMSTYPKRSRSLHPTRKHLYQRYIMLIILLILGIFSLIFVFHKLGHFGTDGDPNFDPLYNPNIHVKDIPQEN